MTNPKVLVQEFWERAFNEGDLSVVDQLIGPAYTFNGDPQKPEEVKEWIGTLRAGLPDLHFTVNDILSEGSKVAIRWTLVGTRTTDGKKVTNSGTNIIEVVDGQALSNWQSGGQSPEPLGG
jgi:predicted ester cyclase